MKHHNETHYLTWLINASKNQWTFSQFQTIIFDNVIWKELEIKNWTLYSNETLCTKTEYVFGWPDLEVVDNKFLSIESLVVFFNAYEFYWWLWALNA